jgi:hypothetical protein
MGVYWDNNAVLGIRICLEQPAAGDYFVKYEFTGDTWKEDAALILPDFLGKAGVIIQTLHHFSTSHNLTTKEKHNTGDLWLNNPYFKYQDLLTL